MQYLPIHLNLRGQRALVVGGGEVGFRKARWLLRSGAVVNVIAPTFHASFQTIVDHGRLHLQTARFCRNKRCSYRFVIAAADGETNRQVAAWASTAGVFVNVVDAPDLSTAIMPAVVDRSPITVSISSAGTNPVLARRLRAWIEALLPQGVSALARAAAQLRAKTKGEFSGFEERRRAWEHALTEPLSLSRLAEPALTQELERRLGREDKRGQVALVGAGPGDPEYLTLKALQALQTADLILYDRLVDSRILEYARRDAELFCVGKAPGGVGASQRWIEKRLIEEARAGRWVVRLKGGDPAIFGRVGEEAAALRAAGVDFSIIPGITAASAAAAKAGAGLTHRQGSHQLRLVTGHDLDRLDLSVCEETLAVYMAASRLEELGSRLTDGGWSEATTVILAVNVSRPNEEIRHLSLGGLADYAGADGPLLVMVGAALGQGVSLPVQQAEVATAIRA